MVSCSVAICTRKLYNQSVSVSFCLETFLQIIYTLDEVSFVQNLVYYVERVYRTPDFGMWGRGSKYNTGKCEVNAR